MSKTPKYLAEAIGTFCLVFAGTGAIIVNEVSGGRITHVGVSLVFGLVVMVMVYTIGHISGAHINPAVTCGFYSSKRISAAEAGAYVVAQICGAVTASLVLRAVFGGGTSLGVTLPAGSWEQSFVLELIMTAILMFVIMAVATDSRAEGEMAGIAIGATIAFEAILGGLISGASMNPARSFGPALVEQNFSYQWLYWAAPILGSIAGAKAYQTIRCETPKPSGPGCC